MVKNVYVFGTIIDIIYESNSEKSKRIDEEILKKLYQLDDECSLFKSNSDVSKINQYFMTSQNDFIKVDEEVIEIIKQSIKYSEITNGDMDITCKPLLDGIKQKCCEVEELKSLVNYKNIRIKEPNEIKLLKRGMQLDLGSIVKGYATDLIVKILDDNEIENAIINLGGNVYVKGLDSEYKKWKVGIQNPIKKSEKIVGYLELTNKSVVTSGTVERGNHIIDPHTGEIVNNHIKSVSIIADKSIDAEGLSTAFFVKGKCGIEQINKMKNIDCIYVDDKKNIYLSDNLKGKFIVTNKRFKIKEFEY